MLELSAKNATGRYGSCLRPYPSVAGSSTTSSQEIFAPRAQSRYQVNCEKGEDFAFQDGRNVLIHLADECATLFV